MQHLQDRVAIVTGGGRHLGRAYSLGLAAEGAAVVVADIIDTAPVVREIEAAGGTAIGVPIDLNAPESLDAMAATTIERFGRVDALINNAGYFKDVEKGPCEDIEIDEWDRAFTVNVRGTWLAIRAVLPAMKQAQYGHIVNVASTTPLTGIPNFLHYVSAKSAIFGMTRALARELGEHGIAVNTLCPDLIPDDEMLERDRESNDRAISRRCFQRTSTPEDMVGAVVYLASSGSDFMTGQSILVNGGIVFG